MTTFLHQNFECIGYISLINGCFQHLLLNDFSLNGINTSMPLSKIKKANTVAYVKAF